MLLKLPSSSLRWKRSLPVVTSHRRRSESRSQETNDLPSGEKINDIRGPNGCLLAISRWCNSFPVGTLHNRIPSFEAEAKVFPSGEKATELICGEKSDDLAVGSWPSIRRCSFPVSADQMTTVRFE